MRIDPARSSAPSLAAKPSAPASGEIFSISDPLRTEDGRMKGIATIGLTAVLALQEDGEALKKRRARMMRRGVALLDALEEIQRAWVGGGQSDAKLEALQAALAPLQAEDPDPEGQALIRAIEVRAAVELAKAGR